MTWRELADLLGVEAQKTGLGLGNELNECLKAAGPEILRLQSASNEAVDGAIAEFVKTHHWPKLGPQDRAMLTRRLLYAENLTRFLAAARTRNNERILPDPSGGEGTLVEWVLIDAWENHELLKSQMFS